MTMPDKANQLAKPEKLKGAAQGGPEPAAVFPPASFFRRATAFLIDLILLVALYFVLVKLALMVLDSGLFSGALLYIFGHFDRLLSAAIALVYFSMFTSKAGLGSTPGQRGLNLRVCDLKGQTIGFWRALLRSVFLAPIFLLFGLSLPAQPGSFLALLESEAVFGLFGIIVVLLILSRGTGQSFHDVLAGTRVVYEKGAAVQSYQVTPFKNIIAAGLVAITIPLIIWGLNLNFTNSIRPNPTSQVETELSQIFLQDATYLEVHAVDGNRQEPGQPAHKDLLVSVTLNPWNKPSCGYQCDSVGLSKWMASYMTANHYIADDVTVQAVEIFDLGFFRVITKSTPVHSRDTYTSTYEMTFLGLFSYSISIENI